MISIIAFNGKEVMLFFCRKPLAAAMLSILNLALSLSAYAQSGNSTSITGSVLDPSGAVVPNATVEIQNPVSGFKSLRGDRWCRKVHVPQRRVHRLLWLMLSCLIANPTSILGILGEQLCPAEFCS